MADLPDLIVVGSGPSGTHAAKRALERGLSVVLVDVGHDDDGLGASVPDRPFSEIRRTDPDQHRYLVGSLPPVTATAQQRVGSHLTPPRRFITRDVDELLPFESTTFFPLQTLALGGLGAGWGAGAHTFESFELDMAGLSWDELEPHYRQVARDVGVSGARDDDTAAMVLAIPDVQPPLDRDTNGQSVLESYRRRREVFRRMGFALGRAPAAILSQPLASDHGNRSPHSYHDMDFYTDHGYSVYRPKYTIEEMSRHPGFTYLRHTLAETFEETTAGTVRLRAIDVNDRSPRIVEGRALALAAGAISSARIALRSLGHDRATVPLLCNPYYYIPCVNMRMLGRPVDDRRHSLGQLTGVLTMPTHAGHPGDRHILSFYSYRSLLTFRLAREMPLPVSLAVPVSRLLQTSLTIVGLHLVDRAAPGKWLELRRRSGGRRDVLAGNYEQSADERRRCRAAVRQTLRTLLRLRCVPLSIVATGAGSSLHYAGTLPRDDNPAVPLRASAAGKLNGTRHVFLADSASWTFLPAKGPTFSLMANARRVADEIWRTLQHDR